MVPSYSVNYGSSGYQGDSERPRLLSDLWVTREVLNKQEFCQICAHIIVGGRRVGVAIIPGFCIGTMISFFPA